MQMATFSKIKLKTPGSATGEGFLYPQTTIDQILKTDASGPVEAEHIENKIESIKYNNVALTITDKNVDLPVFGLIATASPSEGMLKSYSLTKDGVEIGTKIDIPKDFLVKSGSVKTCTEDDKPVAGYRVGDKYIDLVLNTKDGSGTDEHLYILVKDLVDVYTSGDGINIASNVISVKLDTNSGLSVSSTGLKANLVSAFQATPDDTHIATEKLVKDNLDLKFDKANIVSSFQTTTDNDHVASEKLVKDNLDLKIDKSKLSVNGNTTYATTETIVAPNAFGNKGGQILKSNSTNDGFVWEDVAEVKVDGTTISKVTTEGETKGALQVADLGVSTGKLAADAVTNAKLADNAVQTENIVDSNVTTAKLADLNVTTAKLADDAVTADKIADSAVNNNAMFTTGAVFSDTNPGVVPSYDSTKTGQVLTQAGWVAGITWETV